MNLRALVILVAAVSLSVACSGGTGSSSGGGSAIGGASGTGSGASGTGGGASSSGGGTSSTGGGTSSAGGGASSAGGGASSAGGGTSSAGGGSSSTGGGAAIPVDVTCSGLPLPTTAPAMVTLTGTTMSRSLSTTPLADVALEIVTRSGTSLGQGMSDSSGNFSISIATGGVPVDGFIRATKATYAETHFYPPVPWSNDWHIKEVDLITPTIEKVVAIQANVTLDANDSQVFALMLDCSGTKISGATVSSTPAAGQIVYISGTSPDPLATSTDVQGAAVFINVAPGQVTLSGVTGSTPLRDRGITSAAGLVIQTELVP